ncbi:hypothetical protein Kpol_1064p2 [Vanderwaltozyma polyspora DSM 70294]|uniref:Uncharacterized protein n=1 Tax=Vanderwaltozyma polyspora (strain ATCC 22028 / DSM 70294 / BCRC 21397 / CBS 2163 / NBRC 10782 / NRRL Y-8283 / UCD 57-17) TaxID=436907 RepID=A7TMC8_VANPO|nr:uncharacterized protein Kpol_1064p2 [Vanderwaltozyma polyspora DSM 70294]EDO16522.1 hypothetical protein Kpol_1064p2 [Vanderwaltozyma polyspora DSM 70294]
MTSLPTIIIEEKVILQINYQYELKSIINSSNPNLDIPQCFLLLGQKSTSDEITVKACVEFPLLHSQQSNERIQSSMVKCDEDALIRRIELQKTTNPDLIPTGLLLIDMNHNNYEYLIKDIIKLESLKFMSKVLFHYEPKTSTDDLELNCYKITTNVITDQLTLTLIDFELKLSKIPMEMVDRSKPEIPVSSMIDDPIDFYAFEKEQRDHDKFIKKLLNEIDRILNYLQCGGTNPVILRKISLLLSTLKKAPTNDIEDAISKIENEINIVRIACEQWEVGNKISKK